MREADRPPSERVSMLDRAPNSEDRLSAEASPWLIDNGRRLERVRLAMEVDDCKVLIGRDRGDGLHLMVQSSGGGGACGSMRRILCEHGAIVMSFSDGRRVLVSGIVADPVSAVRVGNVDAHLANNAFLAEVGRDDSLVPVITTPEGEREVGPHAP
jgi:hypothetical protein